MNHYSTAECSTVSGDSGDSAGTEITSTRIGSESSDVSLGSARTHMSLSLRRKMSE
jgi:hypothetical protein